MSSQTIPGGPRRPGGRIEEVCRKVGWIAGALAVIMMLALVREVAGRYFFNNPTDWAVDLNSFLLVIMVYLGAAYTTSIDGHVRADFFYGRVRGRTKAFLDIFIDSASIFYVSILLWEGGLLAKDSLLIGEVSSGGVRWPLFPFQMMVPLGAAMVIFLLLVRIGRHLRLAAGRRQFGPAGGRT
ncbi:MAG: TRAP transporter small permease [Syntrophaceae bacterium]|nr:TRAP transporter small permease [Syntrophaceae bacterium]